jgi:5'-3' exonuclease
MVQQRQRRLSSIIDKEMVNDLRKKHGLSEEKYYDTNSITPGTQFMENFNQFIIKFIDDWNNDNKIEIKYSSYHEPGEGEHKIINFIKENKEFIKDKEILIYGLDADLIILNLTLAKDFNIKLLREKDEVSLDNLNMIVFDINECAKAIIFELSNEHVYENYRYIDDFIFITILLGNESTEILRSLTFVL